jgi:hypothetical protein
MNVPSVYHTNTFEEADFLTFGSKALAKKNLQEIDTEPVPPDPSPRKGLQTIAQRFSAGSETPSSPSQRDGCRLPLVFQSSPSGTNCLRTSSPPMKRWATSGRPTGTERLIVRTDSRIILKNRSYANKSFRIIELKIPEGEFRKRRKTSKKEKIRGKRQRRDLNQPGHRPENRWVYTRKAESPLNQPFCPFS